MSGPTAATPPGGSPAPGAAASDVESCATLIDRVDWAATTIGPRDSWPQSLRTSLGICLNSRFPILLWWGPDFVMLYNDAYRPMLGAKHPASMGMSGRECWPEIWEIIGPMLEGVRRDGQATWSENQLLALHRHGYPEECYFTFSYSPIVDESGGVGGVFTAVTETTGSVVGERRLRTLRDLSVDARTVPDAAAKMLAVLRDAPLDVPFALLYLEDAGRLQLCERAGLAASSTPAVRSLAPEALARLSAPSIVGDLETVFGEVPAGPWKERPARAFAVPIAHPGTETRWGTLVLGMSPRLPFDRDYETFFELVAGRIATQLADADAYEAERRRAEALAEIDRAKTAFFTNISHEFRTPLALLLGPLDDLPADELATADRERIEVARRNGRRLLRLVNALLEFSRIEAGRAGAAFEPVDLALVTANTASMFESAFARAGVRFEVDARPIGEPVFVDRDMWERIVLNLVSNAFKHTYEGSVRVRLRRDGDDALLVVEDTGVGIPPEHLPRIFERFHRIESPQARTHEGTGIGLALVNELIRLHGGSIDVASELGRGTAFSVRIPLGAAHLPADQVSAAAPAGAEQSSVARSVVDEAMQWLPAPEASEEEPGDGTDGEGRPGQRPPARVLVVDDNADMRRYIAGILGETWAVSTASDGSEALERVGRERIDLIVADIMMPRMNGVELVERIRRDARTRTIPVILVSARAGEEAAVEGLGTGADDYLVKPFSARDLRARVAAHLSTARLREAAVADLRETLDRLRDNERRLLAALDVKDEFLGMVSHELRSPLTTVLGNSRLLASRGDRLDPETRGAVLEDTVLEAERLNRFIDNLLVLARLDAGTVLSLEPVLLDRVIERVVAAHRQQHPGRRIEVVPCPGGGLVEGHEGSLEQVFGNLLGNAEKYSPPDRPIVITSEEVSGEVVITIADGGPGIDPSEAEFVFRPFYRSRRTEMQAGLGIGLAVCRRLVEAQRGRIWVKTNQPSGAAFCVAFPSASEPA